MNRDKGHPVILDTSVLVHLARNSSTGQIIEAQYHLTKRLEKPILSTISEGEILGLIKLWGWGERKTAIVKNILNQCVSVDPGYPEIIEAYATLYNEATTTGKPRGENDLWIAATAKILKADLLTCDADFMWMNANHLTVHYIKEVK